MWAWHRCGQSRERTGGEVFGKNTSCTCRCWNDTLCSPTIITSISSTFPPVVFLTILNDVAVFPLYIYIFPLLSLSQSSTSNLLTAAISVSVTPLYVFSSPSHLSDTLQPMTNRFIRTSHAWRLKTATLLWFTGWAAITVSPERILVRFYQKIVL